MKLMNFVMLQPNNTLFSLNFDELRRTAYALHMVDILKHSRSSYKEVSWSPKLIGLTFWRLGWVRFDLERVWYLEMNLMNFTE